MAQTSELLLLAPFRTCHCGGLLAVDIEVEVLVLDLLVRAVGTDRDDGGVDLVQIGLVAFAHGNADAVTEVFLVGELRTDESEALAGIGLQETATVPSRRPAATSR
jgi:hypothetical protein